jgi:hypothetical protein
MRTQRTRTRSWITVTLAGLMTIGAATARAADSREAREREARKACFTGNVDRGVEILVDLYGETSHPNYIYNQARCFERNGKYDQALLSYEDYLRKATNLPEADRAQVEKSIAELRAKIASPPAPGGTGEAPASPLLSPALDAPGTAPPPSKAADASLLPPGDNGDKGTAEMIWPWQRTAGVVSLIVTGGGLALGVAGTVLRQSRAGDFNDACTLYGGEPMPRVAGTGPDCRGKYDSVQSAERMMWIGYVSAGVFAAAGATLLVLAPPPRTHQPNVWASRCVPTVGTAGVACGWSF